MRVRATLTTGRQLRPGDLFSTRGPGYWDLLDLRGSVGESVYVRTNEPTEAFLDADEPIYLIEIIR